MNSGVFDTRGRQYLTFQVAEGVYGLDILRVREIIEFVKPTLVPGAPPFLMGIINLRGTVVPVLDLALQLGLPRRPIGPESCIVVVESARETGGVTLTGLVADSVNEVLDLPTESLEPPPAFGSAVRPEFLSALGKLEGSFVLLLNLDHILAAESTAALDRETSEPEGGATSASAHA
jgi:purine-binding chemotaxis protein CheW